MKKLLLFILPILLFTNCEEELDKLTMFNVSNSTEFTVPAIPVEGVLPSLNTPAIETNSNNDFSNNNSRKDLIESAELKRLDLTIISDNGNFNFLNEVELFIKTDNTEEIPIASLTEIPPTNLKTISLSTTDADLSPYLKANTYNVRVRAITDETTTEEIKIKADFTFFVDAKILGI